MSETAYSDVVVYSSDSTNKPNHTISSPESESVEKKDGKHCTSIEIGKGSVQQRRCVHKRCFQSSISSSQYCYSHILEDPTAPYRQCSYTVNKLRCPKPAPDSQDLRQVALCFEHAHGLMKANDRAVAPPLPITSTESVLNTLKHYVKPEHIVTSTTTTSVNNEDNDDDERATIGALDPFKQIDANAVNREYSSSIMDCVSNKDSDSDDVIIDPASEQIDISDAEDAPCEEQPLWRAGVYTHEECYSELTNVMVTLKKAYLKQFDYLRVEYATARLQYLKDLAKEKERYCSINTQARSGNLTARDRQQLKKLKAYASYHRKHGIDAVMALKLKDKRLAAAGEPPPNQLLQPQCQHIVKGFRCQSQSLPAAEHCITHILNDKAQVLFAACGDMRGGTSCQEPIVPLPFLSENCRLHIDPPVYIKFTCNGVESDSESQLPSTTSKCESLKPTVDVTKPPEDVAKPPEDVAKPPEDVAKPPEDATKPPENATIPPENATIPPENATIPPEDTEESDDEIVVD